MPVVSNDGQMPGPSAGAGRQRIDVATETHSTVATDTNYDNNPWGDFVGDVTDTSSDHGELDTDGMLPIFTDKAPNARHNANMGYDSSDDDADSITHEILAARGDPGCSRIVTCSAIVERRNENLVLASPFSSSNGNSDLDGADGEKLPPNEGAFASVHLEAMERDLMKREIDRLTDRVVELQDENDDMHIYFVEVHRSASVACYLEYAQRMELLNVSCKLADLKIKNKGLMDRIIALERQIMELRLGAMSANANGSGDAPQKKE